MFSGKGQRIKNTRREILIEMTGNKGPITPKLVFLKKSRRGRAGATISLRWKLLRGRKTSVCPWLLEDTDVCV